MTGSTTTGTSSPGRHGAATRISRPRASAAATAKAGGRGVVGTSVGGRSLGPTGRGATPTGGTPAVRPARTGRGPSVTTRGRGRGNAGHGRAWSCRPAGRGRCPTTPVGGPSVPSSRLSMGGRPSSGVTGAGRQGGLRKTRPPGRPRKGRGSIGTGTCGGPPRRSGPAVSPSGRVLAAHDA